LLWSVCRIHDSSRWYGDRPYSLPRTPLLRTAGGGLSAIGMRSASWEFHFSQLQSNSKTARVAKTIAESAQPGPTLAAREGRLVARTRFFIEFRRATDEHLLLPGMTRRKEVRRILGLEPGTRMHRSTFPLEFFRKMKSPTLPKTIYEIACRTGVVLMEPVAPPFSTAAPAHHRISLVRR
jgi:hypothetical protein